MTTKEALKSLPGKPAAASRQPHRTLVTALLGAGAIGYLFLIFLPNQRSIVQLRRERNQKQQLILQSTGLSTPLAAAEQRLNATRQCSLDWKKGAPTRSEIVATYARLAEEAKAAGVTLRRFDPQPAIDRQLIGEHNLLLAWEGTFAQIFDFLRRVEQLPATVWARHMNLTAAGESGETLSGELTLTIFMDLAENTD